MVPVRMLGLFLVMTPLTYQPTTSLGLAQLHLRSPKVVVATGAAARGSKKWYNFFCRSKVIVANQVRAYSSSLALLPYSVSQIWYQIWYRPGGCSNEHVRACRPATVRI